MDIIEYLLYIKYRIYLRDFENTSDYESVKDSLPVPNVCCVGDSGVKFNSENYIVITLDDTAPSGTYSLSNGTEQIALTLNTGSDNKIVIPDGYELIYTEDNGDQ